MHWLIHEFGKDKANKILPIEIDIVKVSFHGSVFPCIGIHYIHQKQDLRFIDKDNTPDYGPWIEAKLETLYQTSLFSSFFNYIYENQKEINRGLENYKIQE